MRIKCLYTILIALFALTSSAFAEDPPYFVKSFGILNPAEMYPTDIAVDGDMNVYILDVLNRRVHKRDQNNNTLLLFGSQGKADGQFIFPRGIALDSEGKIYITDGQLNRVSKFDVDGTFIHSWGVGYPLGIAISPSGHVYVADKLNTKIQVFDLDGNFLFNWGERGSTDGKLSVPYYIAIDSSENVWVTDENAHRVIKYDRNGNFILGFGRRGEGAGEFIAPTGITVDTNDNIYVYDRWNFRIQKFDQNGNFITMWGEAGEGDGQMHGLGLASDVDSNIYIADYWNFRAQKFSAGGEFRYKWTGTVTGTGEFGFVHDLAVNHSGNVYVVDRYNQNVQVFNNNGNFLFKWGGRTQVDNGGFNFPRAIAVDSGNNIYVTNDNDIRIFNENGNFITFWPISGSAWFANPLGITVDNTGNVFVVSTSNNEILKMDENGNLLLTWGSAGVGLGQFNSPAGIGSDSYGNIYVVDTGNRRIQKFSNNGVFILSWGEQGSGDGQFGWPIGLAVDRENNVYVVDQYRAQIQKFDSKGNFLTKWGQPGNGNGEFDRPLRIAIDDSAMNIYISDSANGRVQKFSYGGVNISKDTFDGPYHLRVSGNGLLSVFSVDILADRPFTSVVPVKLESNDKFMWMENYLSFTSWVTTGQDGIDFKLPPGAEAFIAVELDGYPNAPQLHVGNSGQPASPVGWLLDADQFPAMPNFQPGEDLGLFVGSGSVLGEILARWNGDGQKHTAALKVFSSKGFQAVETVDFEPCCDSLFLDELSLGVSATMGTWWDGLDIQVLADSTIGISYEQDGLFQTDLVNGETQDLGQANAYALPLADIFGDPIYDSAQDEGLFVWRSESGVWKLRVSAGGDYGRYVGAFVSSLPVISAEAWRLESNDVLKVSADQKRVDFDMQVWYSAQDGIDIVLPQGSEVSLELNGNTAEAASLVQVGGDRWAIESLPVVLAK